MVNANTRNDSEGLPPIKPVEAIYSRGSSLGNGAFGDVLKARVRRNPNRVVALKMLRSRDPDPMMALRLRETIFFRNVGPHPNLVRLLEMFIDSDTNRMVYVLEYMQGTLFQYMQRTCAAGSFPINALLIAEIVKDVLKGVHHIHQCGFVHRDIKPENILASTDPRGNVVIKLADFGLSRPIEEADSMTTRWTAYVATRWYRAPEQLLEFPFHTPALDIWSVSLILGELCNQAPLFPGRTVPEMIVLQTKALGVPSWRSSCGPCDSIRYRLSTMPDWKLMIGDASQFEYTQDLFRWSDHAVFTPALLSGLQWDPNNRPTALYFLANMRRIIRSLRAVEGTFRTGGRPSALTLRRPKGRDQARGKSRAAEKKLPSAIPVFQRAYMDERPRYFTSEMLDLADEDDDDDDGCTLPALPVPGDGNATQSNTSLTPAVSLRSPAVRMGMSRFYQTSTPVANANHTAPSFSTTEEKLSKQHRAP